MECRSVYCTNIRSPKSLPRPSCLRQRQRRRHHDRRRRRGRGRGRRVTRLAARADELCADQTEHGLIAACLDE